MDNLNTLTAKVRVRNRSGIHTRPAAAIVKLLHNCKCQVSFTYKNSTVNAKSILGILTLAAPKNAFITINVTGDGAEAILEDLVQNFETGFGEA